MNQLKLNYAVFFVGLLLGAMITVAVFGLVDERNQSRAVAVESNSCVYLPLITEGSIQPSGCEGIPGTIQLHYSLENQSESFIVVDCLGVQKNWEQTLVRNQVVEIEGLDRNHLAVAREGMFEGWLQVLIWEGSEEPYILNLMEEE